MALRENNEPKLTSAPVTTQPTWAFEVQPDPIPASSIKETLTCDVVVVGGASAGLNAAASAAEKGAKVICLEKYESSAAPGCFHGFINSKYMMDKGEKPIDIVQFVDAYMQTSQGMADARLVRTFAENSGPTGDWMVAIAQETTVKVDYLDSMGPAGGGGALCFGGMYQEKPVYDMMTTYGKTLGIEYRYNTEAVRLLRPNNRGKVSGVIAKNADGSCTRFNANKAVILCTGDYGSNPQMIDRYIPWASGILINKNSLGTNTGDGLKMALWIGALIGKEPHCAMIHFLDGAGGGKAGSLMVNKLGDRFSNEGGSAEILAQIVMRQPGQSQWRISDARTTGSSAVPPGHPFSIKLSPMTASTLDELASKFGADPARLKATVERWNTLVKSGKDLDFGSDLSQAKTIDTAPFSVQEGPPDKLAMMGGAVINHQMQVLDKNFSVILGLYAAGNTTCGFWGINYPMALKTGIDRAFCCTTGRLAGINAVTL